MTFINYANREINCKIVYYGPALCGKTDNLKFIYEKTDDAAKGRLISLATETDRTLFFDFLPLELGNVRGFKTRFHLYSVPGQVFYDASRKLILKGVDGVIFVADSQRERMEANLESLWSLHRDIKAQGYDLRFIPYVLQLNKRDSPTAVPVEEMTAKLQTGSEPVLEAIAHSEEGIGVFDTLKAVAKLVLRDLTKTDSRRTAWIPSWTSSWTPFAREKPSAPERAVPKLSPVAAPPFLSPVAAPPLRTRPVSPIRAPWTERPLEVPFEFEFVPEPRVPASDLAAILYFLIAFLAASALFLSPGSAEFLAVNVAYWILGVAGAFGIHLRNQRDHAV